MSLDSATEKKLGEVLKEMALVQDGQIKKALFDQRMLSRRSQKAFRIGELLLFQKVITPPQLFAALRRQRDLSTQKEQSRTPQKVSMPQPVQMEHMQPDSNAPMPMTLKDHMHSHISRSPVLAWFRQLYQ